ncbi:immunoglobulin-like domain-containing protein [Anaerosporobacter sp.]|uniref:immunoglobulin-like domain-containing protein n=1 Tax=Anaerosporobacter sp. TaxID=1872529 RepID=UPI0028977488|nr:immunoglobulin-like domain-containing protein [Anaerosporobacter sp.]
MKRLVEEYGMLVIYFIIGLAVITLFYQVIFGKQMGNIINVDNKNISDNQILVDADKPVISARDLTVYQGTSIVPISLVTATDSRDGDITDKVTYRSNVNSNQIGNYTIRYRVVNSNGLISEQSIAVLVIER